MKLTNRNIHRDVAYFYIGLIIAFSFSGIILNHRQDWYPMDYVYEAEDVKLDLPENTAQLEEKEAILELSKQWDLADKYQGHRVRNGDLRVDYQGNTILSVNLESGEGTLEHKRKVPVLGHTMYLHKSTNSFWIWYSDIFGAAMLLIAITGLFIAKGKYSFRQRGWKFAILGLIFPLIFLVLFA
jgi:hypothetical protein